MKATKLFQGFIYLNCISFAKLYAMSDVCSSVDRNCNHPDIPLGILQFGKRQQNNTLRRLTDMSLLKCVQECVKTSNCTAVNYRKNWKLCDILGESKNDKLEDENGCIYSEISTWKTVGKYQ